MGETKDRDLLYQWTPQEIEARLGCSTVVFPRDRLLLTEDIARMREYGITLIEICDLGEPAHLDIHDRSHISQVMSECERQGLSIVANHSPGFPYTDVDEDIRKKAVSEGVVAAKVAEEMGAGVLVCHFETDAQSEKSVTEMLEQLQGYSVKLAIENGKDLADYTAFVDKIGSAQFGMVVDIGHTRDEDGTNPFIKKERARENMAQCGKRLIHVHLHDFLDRDHVAPLDGEVQWAEVFAAFKEIDYQGPLMFEAAFPPDKPELAPDYVLGKTAAFPKSFVERYVSS